MHISVCKTKESLRKHTYTHTYTHVVIIATKIATSYELNNIVMFICMRTICLLVKL